MNDGTNKSGFINYLIATFGCKCPRCRTGKLYKRGISFNFKKTMEMNPRCPVCGQPTEVEVGFYYGTGYVSYALGIAISVASLIAWWTIIGLSLDDNRFFYWIAFNGLLLVVLMPWLMRLARSFWISWFVKYDQHWREHQPEDVSERLNKEQAHNW